MEKWKKEMAVLMDWSNCMAYLANEICIIYFCRRIAFLYFEFCAFNVLAKSN